MKVDKAFALEVAIAHVEGAMQDPNYPLDKTVLAQVKEQLTSILYEVEEQIEGVFEEPDCSHCQDTGEYEGDTCPYCKPNKEQEAGERAMDINKGN